jgi:hypothetical protein
MPEQQSHGNCLFCLRDDGGFTAQEHIIPECAGNVEYVLPVGVVCDRCNNGRLSQLDQLFCELHPVKMRRTMLGIPSKTGAIPVLRLTEGTMKFIPGVNGAAPVIEIRSTSRNRLATTPTPSKDGGLEFVLKGSGGKRFTPRYAADLSRSLLKMAFESAWKDHGNRMYEATFDQLRGAILGEPFGGFFALYKRADWSDTGAAVTYQFLPEINGATQMWVGVNFAGVYLCAVTVPELSVRIPEHLWSVLTFNT